MANNIIGVKRTNEFSVEISFINARIASEAKIYFEMLKDAIEVDGFPKSFGGKLELGHLYLAANKHDENVREERMTTDRDRMHEAGHKEKDFG